MVKHRNTERQRQPELSTTEFRESLNDADTRSEGSDDETQMNKQEGITKKTKSLTNI